MSFTKIKRYVTNVYPGQEIKIDGPSVVQVQKVNDHGQIELLIFIKENTLITKNTIKKERPDNFGNK